MLLFNELYHFYGLVYISKSIVIFGSAYPVGVSIYTGWYDHSGVGPAFFFLSVTSLRHEVRTHIRIYPTLCCRKIFPDFFKISNMIQGFDII